MSNARGDLAIRVTFAAAAVMMTLATAATAGRAQSPENIQDDLPADCTFCRPWVFVEGGYARWSDEALPESDASNWTPVGRLVLEVGTPTRHVGLFTHLELAPEFGPAPEMTAGLQAWLLPRFSDFNVTGGVGVKHDRLGVGEERPGEYELRAWTHLGAEYQTPIHEFAIYGQAGTTLAGEAGPEFQVGVRHPLAPWRFHGIP